MIAAHVWRSFPFFGVAFLAGLQNIPSEQYEAAAVDGANGWQKFLYITIRGLRHVILVVLMLSTIWTFNAFEPIYLLTGGGPADATMVYTVLAYEMGIVNMRLGEASAVPVLILPVLGMFIVAVSGLMSETTDDEPAHERSGDRGAHGAGGAGPDAVRLGAALQHGRHGRQDGPRDLRRLHLPAEAAHAGAVRARDRARAVSW